MQYLIPQQHALQCKGSLKTRSYGASITMCGISDYPTSDETCRRDVQATLLGLVGYSKDLVVYSKDQRSLCLFQRPRCLFHMDPKTTCVVVLIMTV